MILSLLIAPSLAADPCQERLQSLQIADHGTAEAVIRLGAVETRHTLQIIEPLTGHGVRATGRLADVHAFAGHHADGTAWLKVTRDGAPVVALNENLLQTDWTGDASRLAGIEPVVIALIYAAVESAGGETETVGAAVLDWMYDTCSQVSPSAPAGQ